METLLRAITTLFCALSLATGAEPAQSRGFEIDPLTAEGQLLQKAAQDPTDAGKIAAYEEFLARYPQHPGIAFAWDRVQPLLLKAGALDKVVAGALVILAADPGNSPAAYNALQAAERKLDVPAIILWSNRTVDAAKITIASTKPAGVDEAALWAANVDYAQQVIIRCEYSFYASALKLNDPSGIVALYHALETMNSGSRYIPMAGPRFFLALLEQKDNTKAQAFAEAAAARNQASEDMLLFIADSNLNANNLDKAAAFATQLTITLPTQPPPPGVAPADWEAKKKATLARAHWIAGCAWGAKSDWLNSEKSMLAALPLIEGNAPLKELLPATYFYLGLSNFSLARRAEARKYFTLCAAIPSPFQAQATKNLTATK